MGAASKYQKGTCHDRPTDALEKQYGTTSARIAKEHGVNPNTVKRDGKFAAAVE